MRYEIGLIEGEGPQAPVTPEGETMWGDTTAARRTVRLTTDVLIREAMRTGLLPPVGRAVGVMMLEAARVAHYYRCEPQVMDLLEGSQALIEDARSVIDRGLTLSSPERTAVGIVMLELAVRGLCSAIGVNYDGSLRAMVEEQKDLKNGPITGGPAGGAEPDPGQAGPQAGPGPGGD